MDRFTLSANTLSKTVKDNPADRIEVEIGDSKQPDFKPQFKIKRWDNEVNFSMRAIEEAGATMVEKDGKVKYKGKDIEVHQYEKTEAGEDGGFEFEWVLNKKPESNVLRTTIQHKGLDFFYQPEITDEEALASMFDGDKRTLEEIKREMRPENVVGSYAVYHSTKQNNIVGGMEYQIGKAFHIYRPHAVDADGVKVWCELDITESELTVTVPEDFLNKASYPVVVDPTFGYTSEGASTQYSIRNEITGSWYNLTEDADVVSISAFAQVIDSSGGATTNYKFGIYDQSDNSFVGQTTQGTSFDNNPTLNISGTVSLTSGNYYLVIWNDSPSGSYGNGYSTLKYDSGATGKGGQDGSSFGTFPNPWSPSAQSREYSIYATYTASGGGYNPAFAHRRLLL